MSSNISQKDPCPCGSGKRYKSCCGKQGTKSNSGKWTGLKLSALGIIVVGGGLVAYMIFSKPKATLPDVITTETPTATPEAIKIEAPPANVQPLRPQPVGTAPEGAVWSSEHGHWHDASGKAIPPAGSGTNPISINPGATPKSSGEPTPQPPGEAPEGAVWSAEHGHWHNASGKAIPQAPGTNPISITPGATPKSEGNLTPQPTGQTPEGKVWSSEHGHWHNASGTAAPSGSGIKPLKITPAPTPATGNKEPN